jgi:hypothetical protein
VEIYKEQQKEIFYQDLRKAYYTGCFAQVEKPKELYDKIIESVDAKPQSEEEIFHFLKNMGNRAENSKMDVLNSNFKISLKLTPEFDVGIFSYICYMEGDSLELYLPDVVLSLNGEVIKPENGMFNLKPGLVKIKYNEQVYTIIITSNQVHPSH